MISDLNTELKLSNQATRLLSEMIINRDIILNRDELLKKVWEDYGFSGSNNSLNVAISELRKAFANMGLDPKLITTIHKTGFRFNGNVELIPEYSPIEEEPNCNPETHTESQNDKKDRSLPKKMWTFPSLQNMSLCTLALLLVACVINVAKFDIKKSIIKEEKKTFLYSFRKCNVFSLGNNKITRDTLAPILSNEKIGCDKDTDIFFKKLGENNQVFKTDYIGGCTLDKNKNYTHCWSIKNSGGA